VDTYGSYTGGLPECPVAALHNDVLPLYSRKGIAVSALLADNGREFCGTDMHPYVLYLALNNIQHRRTNVRRPQTNGFVQQFNRTVLDELCRQAFR
jgi:transposase InsO family protein